jgi:hypothetical protein
MRVPTFALPERSVGGGLQALVAHAERHPEIGPRRGPIRHLSPDRADHDATVLPDLEPDSSEAARRGTGLVAEPEHAVLEPARLGGERDVVTVHLAAGVRDLERDKAGRVHTPSEQVSMVHASPSLAQSAAVVQRSQPGMVVSSQLPDAPHASLVQGLESSQSAAVLQGVQPSTALWPQTPPSQVSVVHVLPSSQSAAVVQCLQPGTTKLPQTLDSQTSVVHASPSSHWVAVLQCAQPVSTVQVLPWPQRSGVPAWQPVLGSQVSTPLQALPSSQSAAVWHGTQPGIHSCEQPLAPPQLSIVQTLPSSQRFEPSSIWPLQLLSLPSQSSGPLAACTSRVALASRSRAFVAYAEAVLTKSTSLQRVPHSQ